MKDKEFNLSDKKVLYDNDDTNFYYCYAEEDVKEFIRLIKETAEKHDYCRCLIKEINQLAGNKLNGEKENGMQ